MCVCVCCVENVRVALHRRRRIGNLSNFPSPFVRGLCLLEFLATEKPNYIVVEYKLRLSFAPSISLSLSATGFSGQLFSLGTYGEFITRKAEEVCINTPYMCTRLRRNAGATIRLRCTNMIHIRRCLHSPLGRGRVVQHIYQSDDDDDDEAGSSRSGRIDHHRRHLPLALILNYIVKFR